ncbi:MAG: phage major capsid protein [Tessaracoccus sp.]|uniref:phage major capsid protein n=1 Tax=Tessaracoccus sp. TaxID=1971211 RepID=UPI001ED6814B|nr:phage major capsid protein [Tessaracoccus sp.]MBK7823609.1 phage major capsid protein [Tessaracoccus sp.]
MWITDDYEKLARAARVTADLLNRQPLPPGTDSISLAVVTGGTSTAIQTEGSAASETDMQTSSTTAAVKTMAGVQEVTVQEVEQSPFNIDQIILEDLAADHATKVGTFVISNNVTNAKGLLNVTGINAITYTDSSATFPELWPKLVDARRQVHTGIKLPAAAVVVHPDRWAWMEAQLNSSGQPYVSGDVDFPTLGVNEGLVAEGLAGRIRGLALPVYIDGNVPVNLGTGTDEDRIIVMRPSKSVLFESAVQAEAFRETAAKSLKVVFRLYSYIALLDARAPKSISVISGTGLTAPTF